MNIAPLAAAILSLASPGGITAPHFADAPLGASHRAESLATSFTLSAREHDVDVSLLVGLAYWESHFDSHVVSSAKAFGILQLLPTYHRDVRGYCARNPHLCDVAVIDRGAQVLAFYKRKCRTDAGAISAYRSGRCELPSDLTRKVLKTRRWIAARVNHVGTAEVGI